MTYDPDRDARDPADVNPSRRPPNGRHYEREGASLSVALMLALMAAFVAVGLWLYATQDHAIIATGDRPATERTTTGAGASEPPLPKTPTSPTVPSPPRQ